MLVGDDVQALRDSLKPNLALYIGGMGAKGRNFYNSLMRRYGWEAEAERIQELYLGGHQREAIAAVPDELVDAVSLVGPKERIRDRLAAWRETPVTTLIVGSPQPEALEVTGRARALKRALKMPCPREPEGPQGLGRRQSLRRGRPCQATAGMVSSAAPTTACSHSVEYGFRRTVIAPS